MDRYEAAYEASPFFGTSKRPLTWGLRWRIRIERWLGTRSKIGFPRWVFWVFPDVHTCYWRDHEPSLFKDGPEHRWC